MEGLRDLPNAVAGRLRMMFEGLHERDRSRTLERTIFKNLASDIDDGLRRIAELLPSIATTDAHRWDDVDAMGARLTSRHRKLLERR